jgi:phage baseplate assembly protein V
MIRFGRVIDIDGTKGRARVKVFAEEIETDFLPVVQLSTERFKCYAMPKVNETVAVILNEAYEGVVLGAIYDEQNVPPGNANTLMLNGNQFGGLLKLKETVDALVSGFRSWTPVPMDGGAALKTIMTSQLAGKTTGTYTNLINETITHG